MNRGAEIASSSKLRSRALEYMWTRRDGSLNGSGRKKRSLIKLKIAVFSPIPSASVTTAISVNVGDSRSLRKAKQRSFIESVIRFAKLEPDRPSQLGGLAINTRRTRSPRAELLRRRATPDYLPRLR